MKRIFTLLMLAALTVGVMSAEWKPSDTEAIRLDAEGTGGQVQMKSLRTDDGKIILSWLRGERVDGAFSYVLHLQVFDANGDAMFGDEGVIVRNKPSRSWTTDYALALAPNGDILLAIEDVRNDVENEESSEVYYYRYNQQGQPVWDADGLHFAIPKAHENAFLTEDMSSQICVSGDNIFLAAFHNEYYMEEANEDNWQPSPWFPNQQMPDSVQVNSGAWNVVLLNEDGTIASEEPLLLDSKILSMNPAPEGNVYAVYDNELLGLDAQLLNANMQNVWETPLTIEERSLSSGMYMPTPLTCINENENLMLSYRVLTSFYGYQVVNYLTPEGDYAREAVSLNGSIDGDAGSAAMGAKENRAFVAWEWAYSGSANYMNVNVVDDYNNYFWTGEETYGVSLDFNEDWGFTPVKVIPVEDGWVVLYGNCTSWNGANFMVVKVDEFGVVMWTKQICEENFKSSGFSVVYDDKNAYIFYTQETQYDDDWNEIPGSAGMFVMCVDISGQEGGDTMIDELETTSKVNSIEIYTIDGRRVNELVNGVNIIRTTDENGVVTTKKVLN